MKKNVKKMIINLLIFILLISITFYVVFKDQDIGELFKILQNVKIEYVGISLICMFIYLMLEGLNIKRTLKKLGEKISVMRAIKYSLIGFFFSSITPAATGGQPMQAYYMHKDKISYANATLTLIVNLCSFQIITIVLSLVGLAFNIELVNTYLIYFFLIGLLLNLSALTILLICIYSNKLSKGLVNITVKVLKVFKTKNIEAKREKLETEIEKYKDSSIYMKNNKKVIINTMFITLIQVLVYYLIPYFIYCAFSLTGYDAIKIISLQAVLFTTVCAIPLPGAVGVSEGGFSIIFKNIYTPLLINSAMIINRTVSFYFYVIICGIAVLINAIMIKSKISNKNI